MAETNKLRDFLLSPGNQATPIAPRSTNKLREFFGEVGTTAPEVGALLSQPQPDVVSPADEDPRLRGGGNRPTFEQLNRRDGIPLITDAAVGDVTDLSTAAIKFKLSFAREPEDKLRIAAEEFGTDVTRFAVDSRGNPLTSQVIVGLRDQETGEPFDLLVNQEGFQPSDLVGMAKPALETVGALLAIRGAGPKMLGRAGLTARGRKGGFGIAERLAGTAGRVGRAKGFVGTARTALAAASGANVVGGGGDVLFEASQGMLDKGDMKEIMADRVGTFALDLALDAGIAGVAKSMQVGFTPFARNADAKVIKNKLAQKRIRERYGEDYLLTAGELTGSPLFLRGEAVAEAQPGASATFRDLRETKTRQAARIQSKMLGIDPDDAIPQGFTPVEDHHRLISEHRASQLPQVEEVGEEAVDAIQEGFIKERRSIRMKDLRAQVAARRAIMEQVDQVVPPGKNVLDYEVGRDIRRRAVEVREQFRLEAQERFNIPGKNDKFHEPKNLARNAKRFINDLVQKPVRQTKTGRTVTEPSTRLNNPKALALAEELNRIAKFGNKTSLDELQKIRMEVDNLIAEGDAIPGFSNKKFTELRGLITREMDLLTRKPGAPEGMRRQWLDANQWYQENVKPFQQSFIRDLYRDPDSMKAVRNAAVMNEIANEPEAYRAIKDFIGENTPEFRRIQRNIFNRTIDDFVTVDRTISGKNFLKSLNRLQKANPAAYNDMFPKDMQRSIRRMAEVLHGVNQRLPLEDLQTLLARVESGDMAGQKLVSAVRALKQREIELNKRFRGNILQSIRKGSLEDFAFEPQEFVSRFWRDASVKESEEVMRLLAARPNLQQKIRTLVVEDIFFRAQQNVKDMDVRTLSEGTLFNVPHGERLLNIFEDRKTARKLTALLGKDKIKDLEAFATLVSSSASSSGTFASAGGISAGMQLASLWRNSQGWAQFVPNWVKQRLAALVITSQSVAKFWVANDLWKNSSNPALFGILMGSEPMIRETIDVYGQDSAMAMFWELKNAIDRAIMQEDIRPARGAGNAPAEGQSLRDFLNPRVLPAENR